MQTILEVSGMHCGACVGHVTKALQSVSGVQSATVDLQNGTATAEHDENTAPDTLIEAVVEAGFGAQKGEVAA